MKNALFATTAFVAAGLVAGAAQAADPVTASVSGYMHAGVGYVDRRGSDADIGVMRDGEIHFNARGTSDNGLTFRGRVELEAFTSGDQIDENWVEVGGAFGRVRIGGDDHASYNLATGTLFSAGAKIGWYDDFGETNPGGSYLTNNRFSDTLGIQYYTPNISGFIAGVSYHPAGGVDGGNDTVIMATSANTTGLGNDVLSFGLNFNQDFSGVGITLSGGYDYVNSGVPAGADDDGWSAGARIDYAGFTLGGLYADGVGLASDDGEWVINGGYETGPWSAVIGYSMGYDVVGTNDSQKVGAAVGYALAPGVTTSVGFEWTDADNLGEGSGAMGWVTLSF